MTEVEQPPQNGIDLSANEEDENSKARPADIEQDMREMERRKRVEAIMGSKLFREELERIVDSARDSGNTAGILQQLSDIVGLPASRVGSVYKASNCMLPINDIRGVESMGYAKGEKILRCKLAATFRLLDLYGWTQGLGAQITARLKVDQEYFLVNPYGLLYHEVTASSLNKVDMQGHIVEQGTTNFGVNTSHFILHSVLHAARPDIRCAIYIGCSPVVAISSLKTGLLPLTKDACVLGEITTFSYTGCLLDEEERDKLVRNLGPNSKVMLLTNHGALCCGETIEEAFFAACHIVQACETQLKLLPVGLDNLVLIPEESRKTIYEQSRRPPEDLAKKFAAAVAVADSNKAAEEEDKKEVAETPAKVLGQTPKWRVGGAEFEALMRMLDNAGYRTGYIYRHPLIKSDPPKPKNDVELPPAVSSLGYLLEEEELFRQGIWKKGVMGKGGDRSRWLNSPNVYQKVEVLETGTPDPKKITKWVAEGSPTHSTPVRIDDPLQFVPVNTNPKEFKRLQQQIKDNRRADKISAGPQSHILEGVTWDEANRIKDATVSQAGDHVVLMGAASKGIIQRGFQHNATVYKAPYAKNPFDNVTDDELNEYKRTVERKKKSIHGEYTDTDFSESEALSSLQTSGAQQQTKQTTTTTTAAAVCQSEPEYNTEHQVMRIETQQAPVPSQPEVVLSDATLSFINGERSHTATNRKPPTGRDVILANNPITQDHHSTYNCANITSTTSQTMPQLTQGQEDEKYVTRTQDSNKENLNTIDHETNYLITTTDNFSKPFLINELKSDKLFQRQKRKVHQHIMTPPPKTRPLPAHYTQTCSSTYTTLSNRTGNDNTSDMPLYTAPSISKSLNSKFEQTNLKSASPLYYNISSNSNQEEDTLSYYTTAYFNNSHRVEGGGESSPMYDYSTSSMADASESTAAPTIGIYSKSLKCCTPQICEQIFESLQKPSHLHHHQNYVGAKSHLDLIWNIPIRRHYSPSISPDVFNTPPRKFKADQNDPNSARKSRSPYRTVSHFGFNSPQRDPQPDHKHVVPMDCRKYIPLRRSVSYEEIFASARYIDLCEHCFELIVRLKPEQMLYRVKLHNLGEYQRLASGGSPQKPQLAENTDTLMSTAGGTEDEDSTNEPYSAFTSQLEPLIEVEEKDSSSNDGLPPSVGGSASITNSTFIDKITRMNYSEISNNFISTPHSVTSQLSLEDVDEEEEDPNVLQKDAIDEELCKELRNLQIFSNGGIKDKDDADESETKTFVSITEIWEFDNWLAENAVANIIDAQDEINQEAKEIHKDLQISPFCEKPTTSSETQTDGGEGALGNPLEYQQPINSPRSLMNRDERTRRKLEFQELWEDHVRYFENRQQVMASVSYSDTESAIDETHHPAEETRQQTPTNEIDEPNEEVFPSQSIIFSKHASNYIYVSNETLDDDEIISTCSKQTFNISETDSAAKIILCESCGSINISETTDSTQKICERCGPINILEEEKGMRQNDGEERSELTPQPVLEDDSKSNDSGEQLRLYRSFKSTNIPGDLGLDESGDAYTNQRIQKFIDDDNAIKNSDGIDYIDDIPDTQIDFQVFQESGNLKDSTSIGEIAREVAEDQTLLTKEQINVLECRVLTNFEKFELNHKGGNLSPPTRQPNENPKNPSKILERTNDTGKQTDPELAIGGCNEQQLKEKNCDNFADILERMDCLQVNDQNVTHKNKSKDFWKITSPFSAPTLSDSNKSKNILDDFASQPPNLFNSIDFIASMEGNPYSDYTMENKENEATDEQLSSMERTILQKIEYHQLNKTEEIFNKIENTIRNKLTPSKLEMLVKEQVLDLYSDEDASALYQRSYTPPTKVVKRAARPLDSTKIVSESLNRSRRSRSLTQLNENRASPSSQCNKTTTPPAGPRKKANFSPERTPSPYSSSKSSNSKRRNFILENIRNAAVPRNVTPQVKRLQGNAQAIFGKNPFGPRLTTSANSLDAVKKSSPIKINMGKPHSSPDCSTNVYAFQSKLVRGSPRFWVSLSQSPARKPQTTSTTHASSKTKKKTQRKYLNPEKENPTFLPEDKHGNLNTSMDAGEEMCNIPNSVNSSIITSSSEGGAIGEEPSNTNVVARVDAEINALGEEIQKIHPRLETYKRKLDDFGNRVAKCARHMDECVATQEDIIRNHCEMKECLLLQQYVDNVTCRVQTFSLSETED